MEFLLCFESDVKAFCSPLSMMLTVGFFFLEALYQVKEIFKKFLLH